MFQELSFDMRHDYKILQNFAKFRIFCISRKCEKCEISQGISLSQCEISHFRIAKIFAKTLMFNKYCAFPKFQAWSVFCEEGEHGEREAELPKQQSLKQTKLQSSQTSLRAVYN